MLWYIKTILFLNIFFLYFRQQSVHPGLRSRCIFEEFLAQPSHASQLWLGQQPADAAGNTGQWRHRRTPPSPKHGRPQTCQGPQPVARGGRAKEGSERAEQDGGGTVSKTASRPYQRIDDGKTLHTGYLVYTVSFRHNSKYFIIFGSAKFCR